jgi:hypothetical protein
MKIMLKNKINWIFAIAILALSFQACEDPDTTFDPINPDLSEDAILGTSQSAARTLNGLERQLAEVAGEYVHLAEIASDNYDNTQTFFNQFLDILNVTSTDNDINDTQFEIARLRELAKSGLAIIGPGDPNYTADQEAEFMFFIGLSHLLSAELFNVLPAEPQGAAQPASAHYALAIDFFEQGAAKASDPATKVSCLMGQARANYYAGNKAAAVTAADAAIAADPGFVRFVKFDALNGARIDNEMQNAIHDRGSFDDLQPLPRLDFLDPKYNDDNPSQDIDMPLLKIEEAHLIKCEAAIADGALGTAQSIMKDIIALVATRPTSTFDDSVEDRTERNPGTRPDSSIVVVASSPGAALVGGLVIDRKVGNVTIPTVSGTSVTDAMVDAVGSEDEALELLYLMRQEIFIAEGRRMTDMGVKFVVSETEQLANANIKVEDTTPNLPSFFTAIAAELDEITYDETTFECTITHDVNAIIVANKTSDFVCPFH